MVRDIAVVCLVVLISGLVYWTTKDERKNRLDDATINIDLPGSAITSADYSGMDLRSIEFAFRGDATALVASVSELAAILIPWLLVWRTLNNAPIFLAILPALVVNAAATYSSIYRQRQSVASVLLTVALAVEIDLIYFVPAFVGIRAYRAELGLTAILLAAVLLTSIAASQFRKKGGQHPFAVDNCKYDNSNMSRVCLRYAFLSRSSFVSTNLSKSNLIKSIISGCDFRSSSMVGININGAKIFSSNFNGANANNRRGSPKVVSASSFNGCALSHSSFRRTLIKNSTFVDADLAGADFSGALFDSVVFTGATANGKTKWPRTADPELLGVIVKV